ncbi:ABC transporter permease [Cohaesibacter sp. CAU 1516]|uniref:ABC transporter permease n=1 Tax=Cohaesibacter sp. CAU 1516 TaxID=2576038 RepID=UPI0010FD1B61|nr:ABC transporter permease [Cohaesibacter sp. CAU 1516]TLP46216.1 ABC transporter permease [Cohaesibacter sp. CAU 1516]
MKKLILPFALLLLWQAIPWLELVPRFILPGPIAVAEAIWSNRALLGEHLLVTLGEVAAGFVIGAALGVAFAVAMMLSPVARLNLRPILNASQAIPVFVLAPILTLWFGYGMEPKVVMTILLVFFPIMSGLLDGMISTPAATLDLAHIARASPVRTLFWLRLPHALPHLAASIRIAITYAPTGAVIGEWIGASKGLGYLMLMANARTRIELMFAALVLIVAMTLSLHKGADWLLKRYLDPTRPQ